MAGAERWHPHPSAEYTLALSADPRGEDVPESGADVPFENQFRTKNLSLPGDGTYDVTVETAPTTFPRHDRENGALFEEDVVVTTLLKPSFSDSKLRETTAR